jgi:hypothetical protein
VKKQHIISKISLVRFDVGRRIGELTNDIEETEVAGIRWFSLAIDENTVSDKMQLSILFRGIDKEFIVTEELAALMTMKETTADTDLYKEVEKAIQCQMFASI